MSSYTGQFDDASEDENERHGGERGMGPGGLSHRFGSVGFPGTPTQRSHHQAAGMPASMLFGESPGSPDKRPRGIAADAAFMSMVQNHRAGFGAAHAGLYAQQAQAALSAAQQAARYPHSASAAFLQQQQAAQYQRMAAANAYGASPGELASLRYQQQQEAAAARHAHVEAQARVEQQSPYGRIQRGSPGSPDHRPQGAGGGRYPDHGNYYGQQRSTPQAPIPYMNHGGGRTADSSPYSYAGHGAQASVEAAAAAAKQAAARYKQSAPAPRGGLSRHGSGGVIDRPLMHRELPLPGGIGTKGNPTTAQQLYRVVPSPQDYKPAKDTAETNQHHTQQSPMSPMPVSSAERPEFQGGPVCGMGRGRGGGGRGGKKSSMASAAPAPAPALGNKLIDPSAGKEGGAAPPEGADGAALLVRSSSPSPSKPQLENLGPPPDWYDGHVPLGFEEDKYWLSELQCFLRSSFAEAFGATENDIAAPMHGRNKPIALGQVGIRCVWCRDEPYELRGQQAVSYPSLITGIYNSVQQMYRLHFDCCTSIPPEIRRRIETLRKSSSSRGGRKQYWVDSAKRLGLVDTPHGIHFGRDPSLPPPPLGSPGGPGRTIAPGKAGTETVEAEANVGSGETSIDGSDNRELGSPSAKEGMPVGTYGMNADGATRVGDGVEIMGSEPLSSPRLSPEKSRKAGKSAPQSGGKKAGFTRPMTDLDWAEAVKKQKEETYPLVLSEDKPLISDYLYLTLEQMEPCKLMDADRVGCYKGREVGFRGLACRHCVGQAGCGRYFPASEASLSQTTTSQTILNHVRNCRRCPIEIRESLELMKRAKMGPGGKNGKPKHGGRKVFFHRLWCRIQGLPIDEEDDVEVKIGRQKGAKNKAKASDEDGEDMNKSLKSGKRKRISGDGSDDDDVDSSGSDSEKIKPRKGTNASNSDDETETEDEEDHGRSGTSSSKGDEFSDEDESVASDEDDDSSAGEPPSWFEGSVRLSRSDDPHWLSELHCFIRSDLTEAFSAAEEDLGTGQPRNEAVEVGQVGIRCVFCASSSSSLGRRPKGHVYFPPSLAAIHQAATDLHRRHFNSCPEMPDDVRETMKSLKGFGAKAEGDTIQYWIDSAREMGLAESPDGIGLRFHRDPLVPSPADDVAAGRWQKSYLVRAEEDKGIVTDQAALLLMQVRPCRFKSSDKRGGPGSRGRDRAIGFPGLSCIHCAKKNNYGRYFPVAAKSLADNAANSIMAHLSSCRRCPEAVKSSLAYLAHRAVLQKAEIGGGWKRGFYKRVWDRLHHERRWASSGEGEPGIEGQNQKQKEESEGGVDKNTQEGSDGEADGADDITTKNCGNNAGGDVDAEMLANEMGDLIKAAAIWLSERDAAETAHAIRTRGGRGRGLPTKKYLSPGAGRGRGRGTLSTKRKRVQL